ncbi:MAG: right-handed parallel beta-helix repeat-containing protein [Candidatus Sumerlaeia bacterium]|nr:right-handed parallel beta-helix repeat-containing protein [Candidatus Sumerlaeia bacterium]
MIHLRRFHFCLSSVFLLAASVAGAATVDLSSALVLASEKLDEPGVFYLQLNPANTYTGSASIGFPLELDCNGAVLDLASNQSGGTFAGITILPDQLLRISNGTVQNADVALNFMGRSSGTIQQMNFTQCEQGIAHPGNGSLVIEQSQFSNFPTGDTWAVNVGYAGNQGAVHLTVEQITVTGPRFGIQARTGSTVTVTGSEFVGAEQSITLAGGSLGITGLNTFSSASFVHVNASNYFGDRPVLTVTGQEFQSAPFGILATRSILNCTNTVFQNCTQGISIQGGSTTISGGEFNSSEDTGVIVLPTQDGEIPTIQLTGTVVDSCGVGVSVTNGTTTIDEATFQNNIQGIVAQGGDLTVTDSLLEEFVSNAETYGIQALPLNNQRPVAALRNNTVRDADFGFLGTNARVVIESCSFTGHEQGIALLQGTGDFGNPSTIVGSTVQNCSAFGVNIPNGGFVKLEDSQILQCYIGLEVENGVSAELNSVTINGLGLVTPGVGIGAIGSVTLDIDSSTIQGHLNSVYLEKDCLFTSRNTAFLDPCFSGIIFYDNTTITVEDSSFLRNGQDGIFTDVEITESGVTRVARPSFSTVRRNLFDESGIGEIDPDCSRFNAAGTGIALFGNGNHTIEYNTILRSRDVGIALLNGATAAIRRNTIQDNRGTGIFLQSAGNALVEENVVAFHQNSEQAGVQIFGSNGAVSFNRNLVHGNEMGLINRHSADYHYWTENVISGQEQYGFLIEEGRADGVRNVFLENTLYQIFSSSTERTGLTGGVIFSTSRRGVFTQSTTAFTYCVQNWWGGTSAINEAFSVVPQGRMGYQNTDTTQFLTSPRQDIFYWIGNGGNPSVISSGSTPYATLTTGVLSSPKEALVVVRDTTAGAAPIAPAGALIQTPVHVWSTREFGLANRGIILQLRETFESNNTITLARFNSTNQVWEPMGKVLGRAVGNETVFLSLLEEHQPLGVYYWIELDEPAVEFRSGWLING